MTFQYFLDSEETIVPGVGFSHFGLLHFCWLGLFVLTVIVNYLVYRKLEEKGRARWRKVIALTLGITEIIKIALHIAGGTFMWDYLPLHLCGINIFLILAHAFKPSKLLNNFLYTVCIPGAMAAILFPSWTALPLLNAFHIHSSIAHILLVMYPLVPALCGDMKPSYKMMPKCLGLLVLAFGSQPLNDFLTKLV